MFAIAYIFCLIRGFICFIPDFELLTSSIFWENTLKFKQLTLWFSITKADK
jgi:hypothetical protein